MHSFLAANKLPHYCPFWTLCLLNSTTAMAAPVQMKTWLLWSWKLDRSFCGMQNFSFWGESHEIWNMEGSVGKTFRNSWNSEIAAQFSPRSVQSSINDAFFNFLPLCHYCKHGNQACSINFMGFWNLMEEPAWMNIAWVSVAAAAWRPKPSVHRDCQPPTD